MMMTYAAILDCQDTYFALFIFSPFGQVGACGIPEHSVVGSGGERWERGVMLRKEISSVIQIYIIHWSLCRTQNGVQFTLD